MHGASTLKLKRLNEFQPMLIIIIIYTCAFFFFFLTLMCQNVCCEGLGGSGGHLRLIPLLITN